MIRILLKYNFVEPQPVTIPLSHPDRRNEKNSESQLLNCYLWNNFWRIIFIQFHLYCVHTNLFEAKIKSYPYLKVSFMLNT